MTLNYKQKIFGCFFAIFAIFFAGTAGFEQIRTKNHKTEALNEKLDAYANIIGAAITEQNDLNAVDGLLAVLPRNMRITVTDKQGAVIYDNVINDLSTLENHSRRPEIAAAGKKESGYDIRMSASTNNEYMYYAKKIDPYYVRAALPYDIQVRRFLKSDNLFLYYSAAMFFVTLLFVNFAADRFAKSIKLLERFTVSAEKGNVSEQRFPDDELGKIGAKIASGYKQLNESKKKIASEREKLLQHVQSSGEGVCFFSFDKTVEFVNGLFVQYLNIIADGGVEPETVFTDYSFSEIQNFLFDYRRKQKKYFETEIAKQGRHFTVRTNIFDDNGFEIIINDITEQKKTHLLKQEMTSNVAHELRTPITSIRGYLETILEQNPDAGKRRSFLEKAYKQAMNLSELVQDMSLLTKIEEVPETFKFEPVDISILLAKIKEDSDFQLNANNVTFDSGVRDNVVVNGNFRLLYSVFRNLTDNVINHAGNNVSIMVNVYEVGNCYCFSFADTGKGVDEKHLNRLFERFYRINEGRTRDTGGTGLGLSIVKNAIMLHKGAIAVKNRLQGGLEFMIRLEKYHGNSR